MVKKGIPLNILWDCIQNMPNGDDLIMWPYWAGNGRGGIDIDDDRTDGSTGWEDKPEDEIPDYIGDIDIDFLKRWI